MGKVIISSNIKKESVRIDPQGNIINPRTREILRRNEPEYVPPKEEKNEVELTPKHQIYSMSIQDEIEETKKRLVALEERKKLQIEEMKKQLAELEK